MLYNAISRNFNKKTSCNNLPNLKISQFQKSYQKFENFWKIIANKMKTWNFCKKFLEKKLQNFLRSRFATKLYFVKFSSKIYRRLSKIFRVLFDRSLNFDWMDKILVFRNLSVSKSWNYKCFLITYLAIFPLKLPILLSLSGRKSPWNFMASR